MIAITKKHSKKPFIIAAIAVLLVVGGVAVYARLANLGPFAEKSELASPGEQKISLERSETEKQATKALQDDPSLKTENNQTDTPSTPSGTTDSGKTAVNVLLTNAGNTNGTVSASGFVTNIVEDGGTCTYTFTNGSAKLTKTASTLQNPTSTTCETVRFPASELSASGKWTVVLKYESNAASGTSNEQVFTK